MNKNIKSAVMILAAAAVMSIPVKASAIDLPFIPISGGSGEQSQTETASEQPSDPVAAPVEPVVTPDPEPVQNTDTAPVYYESDNYNSDESSDTSEPAASPVVVNTSTGSDNTAAPVGSNNSASKITNINAVTDSDGNITLSWDKVDGAKKYVVYLKSGKDYDILKKTDKTSYTYKKAKNGKKYEFMVRYEMGGNLSSASSAVKLTVNTNYKPAVKASVKDGYVNLKWSAVENADKYEVYRMKNGKMKKISSTSKTAAKVKQKADDTGYAVKARINGKWTAVKKDDIVTVKQ